MSVPDDRHLARVAVAAVRDLRARELGTFALPGRLPAYNELRRMHWAARARETARWRTAAWAATYALGLGALERAHLMVARHGSRPVDVDGGLVSAAKPILDGVADALFGGDGHRKDGPDRLRVEYRQHRCRRGEECVTVWIGRWDGD